MRKQLHGALIGVLKFRATSRRRHASSLLRDSGLPPLIQTLVGLLRTEYANYSIRSCCWSCCISVKIEVDVAVGVCLSVISKLCFNVNVTNQVKQMPTSA